MEWQRINSKVMRCGEWSVIRWPWGSYCLWKGDEFLGRFNSFEKAKEKAK